MIDAAIIGGGPAGLSAAINVRARNRSALILSGPLLENPLARAPRVDNYPGLPDVSGAQLLQLLEGHALRSGAQLRRGRVLAAAAVDGGFYLSVDSDVIQAGALILAIGAQRGDKLPGEAALLGRGVSWCATCDGALYRGRTVAVVGLSEGAPAEANYLLGMGCQVIYVARQAPQGLLPEIPAVLGKRIEIQGEKAVSAVAVDGQILPCQGVFVLRPGLAAADLLPQLELREGYVAVDSSMATNLPGVFACGDCTGPPLQAAKAVGQGLVAGQSAAAYVSNH
ncbi:MAG: NAD(P)/FAD-dependent oxidoreductase [Oscillospiraceae bacterium]|nr:NAD(P)/FAD-dependent oxidoreductase [Oscillospiraceae bacterium]